MIRIVTNDILVHRKMLLLLLIAMPLIAIAGPVAGVSKPKIVSMLFALGALIGPVMIPYWFVGMDRLKGPMRLLVSLPVRRADIVWGKALGAMTVSLVFLIGASAILAIQNVLPKTTLLTFVTIAPALIIAACAVSSAIYFLLQARAATIAVSAFLAIGATTLDPYLRGLGSAPVSFVLAFYVCTMIVGSAALILAENVWSRRPSPCD